MLGAEALDVRRDVEEGALLIRHERGDRDPDQDRSERRHPALLDVLPAVSLEELAERANALDGETEGIEHRPGPGVLLRPERYQELAHRVATVLHRARPDPVGPRQRQDLEPFERDEYPARREVTVPDAGRKAVGPDQPLRRAQGPASLKWPESPPRLAMWATWVCYGRSVHSWCEHSR